jgi:hypothetical protein
VISPGGPLTSWIDRTSRNAELEQLNNGQLPKWPTGTDCKSVGNSLRRFESFTAHLAGRVVSESQHHESNQTTGLCDRIALIAQLVERALGKGEVMGPNPIGGSRHQELFD